MTAASPAELQRLDVFRQVNPHVMIGYDHGREYWRAIVPEPDGERVAIRYGLGELLDRLGEVLPR